MKASGESVPSRAELRFSRGKAGTHLGFEALSRFSFYTNLTESFWYIQMGHSDFEIELSMDDVHY